MPKPTNYLRGYRLHQGLMLAGWRLDQIEIQHITVDRYHLYRYPTKLHWLGSGSIDELLKQLKHHLFDRVINSEYGNPYYCEIGRLDVLGSSDGGVTIGFEGSCTRQ